MSDAKCIYIVRGTCRHCSNVRSFVLQESNEYIEHFFSNKDDADEYRDCLITLGANMQPVRAIYLDEIEPFSIDNIKVSAEFYAIKEISIKPEILSIDRLNLSVAKEYERKNAVYFNTGEWPNNCRGYHTEIFRDYHLKKVFQRKPNELIKDFHTRIMIHMRKELDKQLNINNIKFDECSVYEKYFELFKERGEL